MNGLRAELNTLWLLPLPLAAFVAALLAYGWRARQRRNGNFP
jgi:hypothetical protein